MMQTCEQRRPSASKHLKTMRGGQFTYVFPPNPQATLTVTETEL